MYSISIGVEQWTYDSMHIANTSIWMALMNNNCAECSSMWIALHVLCTQFFEWVCLSWQLIQRQKLQHVCAHSFKISLSFFCLSFFMFIFFNVSAIRCRHNRLLSSTHSALTPTSLPIQLTPEIESIFRLKCLCLFYQMCKHFQLSISFEMTLANTQMLLLLLLSSLLNNGSAHFTKGKTQYPGMCNSFYCRWSCCLCCIFHWADDDDNETTMKMDHISIRRFFSEKKKRIYLKHCSYAITASILDNSSPFQFTYAVFRFYILHERTANLCKNCAF